MRIWKLAVALLGAALLIVGPSLAPQDALAQSQPRPGTPTPPTPPPPTPPPQPPRDESKPPPQPKEHSATDWDLTRRRLDAERSAQIDSCVASAKRVLDDARLMNAQMSRLGTPLTFQNLGLRFEQLGMDLYAIARHLDALHEERDDPDFQQEVGPHRMLVMYDMLDDFERVLKQAERLQGTLLQTVMR